MRKLSSKVIILFTVLCMLMSVSLPSAFATEPGDYIVKEAEPPQNYMLSENSSQQAWLKADGTSIVELTFSNYPYGNLLVKKVDATTNAPLSGAEFFVTTGAGTAVGENNGRYTTIQAVS